MKNSAEFYKGVLRLERSERGMKNCDPTKNGQSEEIAHTPDGERTSGHLSRSRSSKRSFKRNWPARNILDFGDVPSQGVAHEIRTDRSHRNPRRMRKLP